MAPSLIGSIFGRGTVYENFDRTDEASRLEMGETDTQDRHLLNDEDAPPDSFLVGGSDSASTSFNAGSDHNAEPGPAHDEHGHNIRRKSSGISPIDTAAPASNDTNNNYESINARRTGQTPRTANLTNVLLLSPRERALWKWANVENLDVFLQEVYSYFLGNGIYCILLTRTLNMLTILFVVGFSTYLGQCIDYSKISSSTNLEQVTIPHCMARMSVFNKFVLWLFALFWTMKLVQYVSEIRRLIDLKNFYLHLLDINDNDMQTISWQHVVTRIGLLRDQNLVTASKPTRLDPHAVANRIMRKDNYMIAMISRNILNLHIPLPPIPMVLRNRNRLSVPFFSRTLEWNISFCIMDFVFNQHGQVRPIFLKETHRRMLAQGLKRRFQFACIINILFAPFIMVYMALLYFFRYFNEYHRDPSSIGSRQYTPLAEWKMREFNELYHLFQERLKMSYPMAARYINQFPREKTVSLLKFISFIAGSFAAVLGIISLIDPELFLGFEITHDRTVLFYIGIFTTILAVSRSMVPEENMVFDPEASMRLVAEYTHYLPKEWDGQLHSDKVKADFSTLYDLKVLILLRELLSIIVTPFILYFSLSQSCEKIVDFFREYSVHVDGLGYVCLYATFDFDRKNTVADDNDDGASINTTNAGATAAAPTTKRRKDSTTTIHAKMLKSYLNFVDNYTDPRKYRKPPSAPSANPDMSNSIMAKFHRLHGSKTAPQPPMNQSITWKAVDHSYGDSADAAGDDKPAGVLGLLNQFYKQTDAPRI